MSEQNSISHIFESFQHLRVMVVGDVMLDHYIFGHVTRISPEAPIPVVEVFKRENRLGGAANVALNLKELGAKVFLLSVVGDDPDGYTFKETLHHHGINSQMIVLDQERKTTVKNRIISRNQQMLRYDVEQKDPLEENTELLLIDNIIDVIYAENPQVVVLQDYNKGVLTPKLIANIIHNCKQAKIPVVVDPKYDNFFEYRGCTLIKPNLTEAINALEIDINPAKIETLVAADSQLRSILQNDYTVITLSSKGIFVATPDDHEICPAYQRNITDVSGAGDTVLSILALGIALELDIFATVELANIAAGLVCEQVGVVPVEKERLFKEASALLSE
ncbi:MAG: D-glycero-beta-D-manno-heptose-7-phosphate kinase [Sphingobacteriales bacterium]|nr:MAG: D-glycero-beta-D-manno-heptose-7-phosphate kinase [Sphingobacteriales bacterium]